MYNSVFLYYGLLAMLTQLVIFRELSVLFYGSELFLGTFLSSWLFWVGLGSLLARRLLKKEQQVADYFSYGFLALSLSLPFVVLSIRLSKGVFSFGEFIGPVPTILLTFVVMSFVCFVIGGQFSLACAIASDKIKPEAALGRVYLYEALGSVIGGALFTYLLIGTVPTFIIILALSLGCITASFVISAKKISIKNSPLIALALIVLFVNFKIEPIVDRIQWRGYELLQQREARNATLSLAKMGSIKNVFIDGMLSASFPSPENYEPIADWPLLASANPSKVLVMGDVSLGALKEVLKHDPQSVDYVILDDSFLDLVMPYLDAEDIAALRNPHVNIHYGDARNFVKNKENKYDAVIINIQEVPNLKLNRFYTEEFYSQIKSVLSPNGVLGLSVASSENYLSPQTRKFNSSVYLTLRSVFDNIEIIPGDIVTFLASPSAIDMRKETILEHFNNRRISNRYFVPSYIEYKLTANRRTELKKLLEGTPGVEANRDFRPTTYYYFSNFWLNKFTSPLQYLALSLLGLIIAFIIFRKKGSLIFFVDRKESVLIFALGFMSILLEVILLLGFQVISGYVYWQMGILFASFMFGLFLGAVFGLRLKCASQRKNFIFLIGLSLGLIALSICIGYFIPHLVNLPAFQNIIIFLMLLMFIGTTVGVAFVVAGFLVKSNEIMAKAGTLYAADLWGAASGAIFSTNFIIPFFGLLGALNFSAVMGFVGLVIFLILSKDIRRS